MSIHVRRAMISSPVTWAVDTMTSAWDMLALSAFLRRLVVLILRHRSLALIYVLSTVKVWKSLTRPVALSMTL